MNISNKSKKIKNIRKHEENKKFIDSFLKLYYQAVTTKNYNFLGTMFREHSKVIINGHGAGGLKRIGEIYVNIYRNLTNVQIGNIDFLVTSEKNYNIVVTGIMTATLNGQVITKTFVDFIYFSKIIIKNNGQQETKYYIKNIISRLL